MDELFELISSLTQGEKKHFRLESEKHVVGDKNNYIRLFEYLDRQNSYHEKKLLRHFKKEAFTNNLARIKHYLYELIMKSLRNYHSYSTIHQKAIALVQDTQILYNRRLYTQSAKNLRRLKKLITQYGLYEYHPIVLDMEYSMASIQSESMEPLIQESRRSFKEIENKHLFRISYYRLYNFHRNYHQTRTKEEKKLIKGIISKNLPKPTSFSTEVRYLNIISLYNVIVGNYGESAKQQKKLLDLFDKNPEQIKANIGIYSAVLNNQMSALVNTGQYEKFKEVEKKVIELHRSGILKKLTKTKQESQMFLFCFRHNYYLKIGDFENLQKLKNEFIENEENHLKGLKFSNEITLYYEFALSALATKNLKDSLKWTNRILDHPKAGKIRQDVFTFTKILELIIHFELNNRELLLSLLRSTYRYLIKKHKLFRVEHILINYIRKLPGLKNEKEITGLFQKLHNDLSILKKFPEEKGAMDFMLILEWLESKITGNSLIQITRGKLE